MKLTINKDIYLVNSTSFIHSFYTLITSNVFLEFLIISLQYWNYKTFC